MSRLLDLYPRAWRARYGPEIVAILGAQPPTLGDRFDLIRGAFDAHLHPELVDRDAEPRDVRASSTRSVLAGVLIALGSASWLAGIALTAYPQYDISAGSLSALGILVPLGGLLFAVAYARLVWSTGPRGRFGSVFIAAFALAIVPMVWPMAVVGFWGLMITLALIALSRAADGSWPVWLGATIAVAGILGLGTNTDNGTLWLATLPPLAMTLLALLSLFGRLPAPRAIVSTEGAQA